MDAAQQSATTAAPTTPILTRDPDHLYWLSAPPKPRENVLGVTEVMVEAGLESDEWFTETDSSRGTAIHGELANAANGLEPFPFLDPDLYGWCKSGRDYLAYLLADGAVILGVERMGYNPLYKIAGTIDLHVLWRGYEWILDWKSGKATNIVRFKLAAYDMILGPTANGKPRKRAAIEVHEDGSRAKLIEYNTPENFHDGNRFLAYLTTVRDVRQYGPKRKTRT